MHASRKEKCARRLNEKDVLMRRKRRNLLVAFFTFRWLLILPVIFYKKCVSPLLPNVCRYTPSCSEYMLQSVKEFGLIKGGARGFYRIIRCNPFSKGGFDPVPLNTKGEVRWLF